MTDWLPYLKVPKDVINVSLDTIQWQITDKQCVRRSFNFLRLSVLLWEKKRKVNMINIKNTQLNENWLIGKRQVDNRNLDDNVFGKLGWDMPGKESRSRGRLRLTFRFLRRRKSRVQSNDHRKHRPLLIKWSKSVYTINESKWRKSIDWLEIAQKMHCVQKRVQRVCGYAGEPRKLAQTRWRIFSMQVVVVPFGRSAWWRWR